jgi:hypothetical protein
LFWCAAADGFGGVWVREAGDGCEWRRRARISNCWRWERGGSQQYYSSQQSYGCGAVGVRRTRWRFTRIIGVGGSDGQTLRLRVFAFRRWAHHGLQLRPSFRVT